MTPTPSTPPPSAEVSASYQHTNRLAREKSPYLLQHAHNPVDWYPWGEEAFAKARKEHKPIFLSIGYSTCHWCHVMERESFENEKIAALMNRDFVCIKVDREERPDVDRVYMTFVQATTGGGGWPMSVWLTPDLKPFVGGTYFPPDDRYGQPGFPKVLERIATLWKQDPAKVAEQGTRIVAALQEASQSAPSADAISGDVMQAAYQQFARTYDAHEGGFGGGPKFPRPSVYNFLTRFYARNPKSESGEHAREMTLFSLRKMAAGGIHDHLGGGFHRYAVDGVWHVPHFEKMLYDQGQLACVYLDAFQISHEAECAGAARDVLDYVRRDMTAKMGGFYSAEDADSAVSAGAKEKMEGAFYVWTQKEIESALADDAKPFAFRYGVEEGGNVSAAADAQGELRGKNVLFERHTLAETAKKFGESEEKMRARLDSARAKLLAVRDRRPRPHLDDKITTAWNGLMISAFARGGQVLADPSYLETAKRAATFLRENLYDAKAKTLARSYRDGRGKVDGFADDYAFVIQGLLDLYEASGESEWMRWAVDLQTTQDRLFYDEKHGGYFTTTGNDPSILLKMKDDSDSAEPAASSVSALNLARLGAMLDRAEYTKRAEATVKAFGTQLASYPSGLPQLLAAHDFLAGPIRQIVLAGDGREFQAALRDVFLPRTIVLFADGGAGQEFLASSNDALKEMKPVQGKPAAYVCENFTCKAPVTDASALLALLKK